LMDIQNSKKISAVFIGGVEVTRKK
jgi:hypothetical protein